MEVKAGFHWPHYKKRRRHKNLTKVSSGIHVSIKGTSQKKICSASLFIFMLMSMLLSLAYIYAKDCAYVVIKSDFGQHVKVTLDRVKKKKKQ